MFVLVYVYTYPLLLERPSHFTLHPPLLGHSHSTELSFLCYIQQLPTS